MCREIDKKQSEPEEGNTNFRADGLLVICS